MKEEFWTDLNKDWESPARELPGDLDSQAQQELKDQIPLRAQEPYTPAAVREMRSRADALGSYTGIPADPNDCPVQDADDL